MGALFAERANRETGRRSSWTAKKTIVAGAGAISLLAATEYASFGATEQNLTEWGAASRASCADTATMPKFLTVAETPPRAASAARVRAVQHLAAQYPNTRFFVGRTPLQRIVLRLVNSRDSTAHYVPFLGENRIYIDNPPRDDAGNAILTDGVLNRVVAELAHVEQARRQGQLSYSLRVGREMIGSTLSGRPYSDLWLHRGSFEHEAHNPETGIEGELRDRIEEETSTSV